MRRLVFTGALALLALVPASASALTVNKIEVTKATVTRTGDAQLVLVVNCSGAEFIQGELYLEQKLKKGEQPLADAVPGADCTGTDQVRVVNLSGTDHWKPGRAVVFWDIPGGRVTRRVVLHRVKR
jgi:hypothetical protein